MNKQISSLKVHLYLKLYRIDVSCDYMSLFPTFMIFNKSIQILNRVL